MANEEQGKTKEQIEQEMEDLEEQKKKLEEQKPAENVEPAQEFKPEPKVQEGKQLGNDTNDVFVGILREQVGDRNQWKVSNEKYVMSVMMNLNRFGSAIIKGRGRAISRCFDIAHYISLESVSKVEKISSNVILMPRDRNNQSSEKQRVTQVEITLKKI